jgi:four helix bundle protein
VLTINVSQRLSKNYAGQHLSKQIVRSGSSPGLHYGEAQSAESRKDFIHKLKWVLKELRETHANLKIIQRANLSKDNDLIDNALLECNELISIFVKSAQTARKNMN